MKVFRRAIETLSSNRRAYIGLNIAFYGLVLCGMAVSMAYPSIQERLLALIRSGLSKGALAPVRDAYAGGNTVAASVLTLAVNGLIGAFAAITLPSLLIPFCGVVCGLYRAGMWGLALAPIGHKMQIVMLPHSLTLILEGQAYVLAMLGAYLVGKWFVAPHSAGFATRKQGYIAGVKVNLGLYSLILAVLAVSAVYEAIEVIAVKQFLAAH
ncbi:MAG: hypothetical protein ABSC08_00920 [Bryobacteraceae bacterium]